MLPGVRDRPYFCFYLQLLVQASLAGLSRFLTLPQVLEPRDFCFVLFRGVGAIVAFNLPTKPIWGISLKTTHSFMERICYSQSHAKKWSSEKICQVTCTWVQIYFSVTNLSPREFAFGLYIRLEVWGLSSVRERWRKVNGCEHAV